MVAHAYGPREVEAGGSGLPKTQDKLMALTKPFARIIFLCSGSAFLIPKSSTQMIKVLAPK